MGPQQIPTYETRSNAGLAVEITIVDGTGAAQDVTTWSFQGLSEELPMTVAARDGVNGIVRIEAAQADIAALFGPADKFKVIEYDVLANVPGLPLPALVGFGVFRIKKRIPAWVP